MDIEYRKLVPYESKMYRKIRLESLQQFPDSFETNYEEALNTEKLRMEIDIENQNPKKFVWGAFIAQKLIALCAFVIDDNNVGNIYQMYVKKDFQGENIGSGLIQSVIQEAKEKFNITEVFLEVAVKNHPAYYLYKKNGFEEADCERNETSEVIVMKYTL
ncbi:GNAT family N-acetyltransferase [Chryseobacterium tructae]|uniref:GNAT family N-acetyltransferase n=1 Tax=Chryseobacterium tructae TaxID=1037380 RepID=A0ABV7Y214_9FLAO|nr:GNAT family N-acetyltransferase [Chryseobacterium tructae]MDN3693740.1 GNAT family N-acetyltransferase [Chryseobacterium tructae]